MTLAELEELWATHKPPLGMTGKQMCETISYVWRWRFGENIAPEKFWNYSPTGELSEVWFLYWEAEAWLLDGVPIKTEAA